MAALLALLALAAPAVSGCADRPAQASAGTAAPRVQPAPGPAASATPSATARGHGGRASRTLRRPDGSMRVVDVEQGFTLDLPRGFTRITSPAALDAALHGSAQGSAQGTTQDAAEDTARLRAALALTAPGGPGAGRLLALDPARGAVITLLTTPAGAADGADLAGQAAAIRDQLETTLDTRVTVTTLRVDGEPAVRGEASVRSGRMTVRLTDVYAVHGGRFYTVAIGLPERAGPELATRLLGSLHFLG